MEELQIFSIQQGRPKKIAVAGLHSCTEAFPSALCACVNGGQIF
jgi:hypothetical protein